MTARGGTVQLTASGKRVLNASGRVAVGDDCCCAPADCVDCGADPTPRTLSIVFAGITACAGCVADTYAWVSNSWRGGAPDAPVGPFTLHNSPSEPCVFRGTAPLSGTGLFDQFNGSLTCAGDPFTTAFTRFDIAVTVTAGHMMIEIGPTDTAEPGIGTIDIMWPTVAVDRPCQPGAIITAVQAVSGGCNWLNGYHLGGTATVTVPT